MGGRRRCCCGGECVTFTDDFERPDAETPGEDWEVASGTWGIASGELYETGTPGAAVIFQKRLPVGKDHPSGAGCMGSGYTHWMHVSAIIRSALWGRTYSIYVNYKDADNYHRASFRYDTEDSVVIGLYRCIEGVEEKLKECSLMPASIGRMFYVWFTQNWFVAYTEDVSGYVIVSNPGCIAEGWYAGLGHSNSVEAVFDDFVMRQIYDDDHTCPVWGVCLCDDGVGPADPMHHLPDTIIVTVVRHPDDVYGNPEVPPTSCKLPEYFEVELHLQTDCGVTTKTWAGEIPSEGGCLAGFWYHFICNGNLSGLCSTPTIPYGYTLGLGLSSDHWGIPRCPSKDSTCNPTVFKYMIPFDAPHEPGYPPGDILWLATITE